MCVVRSGVAHGAPLGQTPGGVAHGAPLGQTGFGVWRVATLGKTRFGVFQVGTLGKTVCALTAQWFGEMTCRSIEEIYQ